MRATIRVVVFAFINAAFFLAPVPALAQSSVSATPIDPKIPATERWDIKSKITGRTYRIFITRPLSGRRLPSGPSIFYVLDGNLFSNTAGEAAWNGAIGPQIKPALVVGIGYPTDDINVAGNLRGGDLAPHAEEIREKAHAAEFGDAEREELEGPLPRGIAPGQGAEKFFRFSQEELQPRLRTKYGRLNAADATIWGHSLGGLFVLETLFNHPTAFRSYVISSPGIWFQNRRVLKNEGAFGRAVRPGKANPRVLILSGGNEGKPYPKDQPLPPGLPAFVTRAYIDKLNAASRMFQNARELAGRLNKVKGLTLQYHVFADEDHFTMIPASIERAVTFGLGEPGFYGNK